MAALACSWLVWAALGRLECSGLLWAALDCSGLLWTALVPVRAQAQGSLCPGGLWPLSVGVTREGPADLFRCKNAVEMKGTLKNC